MAKLPSARSIGLGAFVLGGILLFSVALFLIGNRRMLFENSFVTYAEFRSLSGIQVGAGVRVAGMEAGEVKDIEVPARPDRPFRLKLQLREDLHPLVRTDSVATIQSQGLVGAQFLQVGAGTRTAPPVRDGGTIQSREPFEFTDLLLQMSDTVKQVNAVVAELQDNVEQAIDTIEQTASDADALIVGVSGDVNSITRASTEIIGDTRTLLEGVRTGRGTVGRLFTDDELYRNLAASVADAQKTVASMREIADQAKGLLQGAGGKGGQMTTLGENMAGTLGKARESMANLADATEALKHNFLLRGFFNRRGYFTLSELSPLEYRRGALEVDGRQALRIWLGANVLFAQDQARGESTTGAESITEQGKARLDSAMGQFLKYRKTGPIVIEGYADGADTSLRYLRSRERADLVREYLLERFQLDPASTGAIALGNEAVASSPSGRQWDGIGLAVFVQPRTLSKE